MSGTPAAAASPVPSGGSSKYNPLGPMLITSERAAALERLWLTDDLGQDNTDSPVVP